MTQARGDALGDTRREAAAVRRYLEWLATGRHKRDRRRTAGSIRKRLDTIDAACRDATPSRAAQLAQERVDLEGELDALEQQSGREAAEAGFVKHARHYADRKGISYAAFRAVGVPPAILKSAGISRNR